MSFLVEWLQLKKSDNTKHPHRCVSCYNTTTKWYDSCQQKSLLFAPNHMWPPTTCGIWALHLLWQWNASWEHMSPYNRSSWLNWLCNRSSWLKCLYTRSSWLKCLYTRSSWSECTRGVLTNADWHLYVNLSQNHILESMVSLAPVCHKIVPWYPYTLYEQLHEGQVRMVIRNSYNHHIM